MEVKVSKIRNAQPPPKTYLDFEWECTACGETIQSQVVENTLFQYKKRNLGPMKVKNDCSKCGVRHSMELRL